MQRHNVDELVLEQVRCCRIKNIVAARWHSQSGTARRRLLASGGSGQRAPPDEVVSNPEAFAGSTNRFSCPFSGEDVTGACRSAVMVSMTGNMFWCPHAGGARQSTYRSSVFPGPVRQSGPYALYRVLEQGLAGQSRTFLPPRRSRSMSYVAGQVMYPHCVGSIQTRTPSRSRCVARCSTCCSSPVACWRALTRPRSVSQAAICDDAADTI